jgi:phosphoglycolate phosphatase
MGLQVIQTQAGAGRIVLFFDLDGPLLDVSPRYVRLHQDLLAEAGVTGMEARRYWQHKRACCPEEAILHELGVAVPVQDYLRRRLELIETSEYLVHDRLWPWAHAVLAHFAPTHPLVLVTARACRPLLLEQLERLGLRSCFHEVLSTPAGRRVDEQKADLIRDYLGRHGLPPRGHWMIGDTEADVGAGRLTGQHTVAVVCGIRDRTLLLRAEPSFLLEDIRDLYSIVGPPLPTCTAPGDGSCLPRRSVSP